MINKLILTAPFDLSMKLIIFFSEISKILTTFIVIHSRLEFVKIFKINKIKLDLFYLLLTRDLNKTRLKA